MNLRFNLSPWKKNAAIVAAAVTVVAGVVAGRERPSTELILERAKPVQDDGIDLARLQRPEATPATTVTAAATIAAFFFHGLRFRASFMISPCAA